MAQKFSQKNFALNPDEKLAYEAACTWMRGMSGRFARLYVTNARVVIAVQPFWQGAGGVASVVGMSRTRHTKIGAELPIGDVAGAEAAKFLRSEKLVITPKEGKPFTLVTFEGPVADAVAAIEAQRR
ncbi:MAG: hypothetical protein JNJ73_16720 [Hyphomonadaceae bacterium]|nr:hypothetical protein [Hyphomonadaceae bacterium]